jgi:sulfate adenylyltransferase
MPTADPAPQSGVPTPDLVAPLGGALVDRRVAADQAAELSSRAAGLPQVVLSPREAADLDLLAVGAYSPLQGFMTRAEYDGVVESATLPNGVVWTLPVTLPLSDPAVARGAEELALVDEAGRLRGVVRVAEVFERDLAREAREGYRTEDQAHPGVAALFASAATVAGGQVTALPSPERYPLAHDPAEIRALMRERGWRTVVGFQTRNPVHRAHEYLTKVALEQVDGLLLHPLVGATKDDDIPADVRMRCYEVLLERYYPPERVLLGTFPAAMRYAGPREAVFHGLVRRNYGCSHFIIGRDAAGVGKYYGTYDAQKLYDELGGEERLGFNAFKFEHTFYCNACEGMASTRTCPHGADDRVILSGTAVRKLLGEGGEVPHTFTRPEVAVVLAAAYASQGDEVAV